MWLQLFWVEQQLQEATPDPKVVDPGCVTEVVKPHIQWERSPIICGS